VPRLEVKKAILPVAGLGTRFLPITKAIPKEMMPIIDKPTIHFIVEEAFSAGIEQIILVNGHHKGSIEDYFDVNYELNDILSHKGDFADLEMLEAISKQGVICSVRQKAALGLGHAVWCARSMMGEEPFAVMLGDDVILTKPDETPAMGQLIEAFHRTGVAQVALMQVPKDQIHLYGAAEGHVDRKDSRNFVIENLVEKPKKGTEKTDYAVVGRYVLTPSIWPILEQLEPGESGEIQLTEALYRLMNVEGLMGHRFSGQRIDTGDRLGYLKANLVYALAREDLASEVSALMRELLLEVDTKTQEPFSHFEK
jgi:UTP--glucose-1-phosphate uridylyltransferase